MKYWCLLFLVLAPNFFGCHTAKQSNSQESGKKFEQVFNGIDLTGWVNVNDAPDTWLVAESALVCTGKAPSNLRSWRQYENYILEFEYSTGIANGQASIILHADALPGTGLAFPQGIRIDFRQLQEKTDPTAIDKNAWYHFRIVSKQSKIIVSVNGREVLANKLRQRHCGYINFSSIAQDMKIRNIRIEELPSSTGFATMPADENTGFKALYNSSDLSQWNMLPGHLDHWTAMDWRINYDGKSAEKDKCLWTKKSYRNFILVADVRLTRKPVMAKSPVVLPNGDNAVNTDGSNKEVDIDYAGDTGIYLRGDSKSQVNIGYRYLGSGEIYGYRVDKKMPQEVRAAVTPKFKADKLPGEWNRFIITMKGEQVTVSLNGQIVINDAKLPGVPQSGPIALQDDHADNNTFQFANLYIKELN